MVLPINSKQNKDVVAKSAWLKQILLPLLFTALGFLLAKHVDTTQSLPVPQGAIQSHSSAYAALDRQDRSVSHEDDGWASIQVFRGPSVDVEQSKQLSAAQPRFFSQARQDELVAALFRNKTNGYFVDLAANDAHSLSNTAALEYYWNWTGLCIEPNPMYWFKMVRFRRCQAVAAVVGRDRNEKVMFNYEGRAYGGIEGFDNKKTDEATTTSLPAYTVPLLEVLERNNAPLVIDYLSLDVEGAETYIMMNFPLTRYSIKVMTAERLKGEIVTHLEKHGYEFVKQMSSWGESLWVNSAYKHELDLDAIDKFDFPILPKNAQKKLQKEG